MWLYTGFGRCGEVFEGDIVLALNNRSLENLHNSEIKSIVKDVRNDYTLKIQFNVDKKGESGEVLNFCYFYNVNVFCHFDWILLIMGQLRGSNSLKFKYLRQFYKQLQDFFLTYVLSYCYAKTVVYNLIILFIL